MSKRREEFRIELRKKYLDKCCICKKYEKTFTKKSLFLAIEKKKEKNISKRNGNYFNERIRNG